LAAKFHPQIGSLNIDGPVMHGYQPVVAASRDARTKNSTSLMAAPGYGFERDRRRAVDAGFDEH
jgi:hypothetical protein